ncbi:clusterin [Elephas maximus indicus]|uniref:clusterin n=1 Tax=Elephas maximus indicus TaxID=99487 RepID=UPI0021171A80|nr:clusterin [Elephas maximus indicus]
MSHAGLQPAPEGVCARLTAINTGALTVLITQPRHKEERTEARCQGPGRARIPEGEEGKMKTLLSLLLLGLLLNGEKGQVLGEETVSANELQEMSTQGSKYIDEEIQNALNGMKEIKTLMGQTDEERQTLLSTLEKAKKQKEDAVKVTRDTEMKLKASPEVCNDTMTALWEECKPCLKHTCVKFYTRVCRSGSPAVGHQLDEFLNQTSPFYIWIDGDRVDTLLENNQEQTHMLDAMEDRFSQVSRAMDKLFQSRFFRMEPLKPFFHSPFSSFRDSSFHKPYFFYPKSRVVRNTVPFFFHEPLNFLDLFRPFSDLIQQAQQAMDISRQPLIGEFATGNSNDTRLVCREMRRNSTGCLKMKDQCEKCQEILSVDCSASNPAQAQLRQELKTALQIAEKFTKQYDELLRSYQQKMFNTSSLLSQLNQQFSWVSQLANHTQNDEAYLQVFSVTSKTPDLDKFSKPGDTEVVVKLFDSDPMTVMVSKEVSWDRPKFMEIVAKKALDKFREKNQEEE